MPTAPVPASLTPADAWRMLAAGNTRFVNGTLRHPHHSQWRRRDLAAGQHPFAAVFSCADSRVPPEIVFDRGLGDVFTIRTAGHVVDEAVLGTIEYGVGNLGIPVLAVMGHEACGCIAATIDCCSSGTTLGGHLGHLIDGVTPSVLACTELGVVCMSEVMEEHVRRTVYGLLDASEVIKTAVDEGRLAVVALTYRLDDGAVALLDWVGDIGRARTVPAEEAERYLYPQESILKAQDSAAAAAVTQVTGITSEQDADRTPEHQVA